jgi:tetratricopeptide (TPR) repeat protein
MMEKGSATHSASSGDPTLDRRYAWAEAALKDGDAQAAVEILDQTLADAFHFTAAWHLYGLAQETLGHNEEAATAWRQCLVLDPNDHFGARLDLARSSASRPASRRRASTPRPIRPGSSTSSTSSRRP